jgi:hypothetical protein
MMAPTILDGSSSITAYPSNISSKQHWKLRLESNPLHSSDLEELMQEYTQKTKLRILK